MWEQYTWIYVLFFGIMELWLKQVFDIIVFVLIATYFWMDRP